jgi:hypothetical protein
MDFVLRNSRKISADSVEDTGHGEKLIRKITPDFFTSTRQIRCFISRYVLVDVRPWTGKEQAVYDGSAQIGLFAKT